MSNYSDILNAVSSYYGTESDIFRQMYNYSGGLATNEELAKAISQVPNVRTVRSASGKIKYFEYVSEEYQPHIVSDMLANSVNSNTNVATTASGATKVKVPVEMSTSQGTVTGLKSGLKQAGNFTLTEVAPAIAAASVGISVGKKIDSTLYNLNPDFWDEHGLSEINPETWNNITTNDTLSGRLFNMVFKLNPNDGTAQPYIDSTAYAYLLQYMIEQGVFNTGAMSIDGFNDPDAYEQSSDVTQYIPLYEGGNEYSLSREFSGHRVESVTIALDGAKSAGFCFIKDGIFNIGYLIASTTPKTINYTRTTIINGGTPDSYTASLTLNGYTVNGKPVYYGTIANSSNVAQQSPQLIEIGSLNDKIIRSENAAYLLLYGDKISGGGGVAGITDQTGAIVFNPSSLPDDPSISDILSALQTQFPDLFTSAVTNTIIDPETGEEITTTYLPVGYPDFEPENPSQPITENSTQQKPYYDPEEYPDISNDIAKLISWITKQDPETGGQTMEDDPVDTSNPPDTGNGNTPAILTPTGSAEALFAVYNPTQSEINSFGAWLWSNNFVDQLKKIFNDPMESIISLHKIFVAPSTGGAQNIYVGYLDSGVSSDTVNSQYVDVDCGSVTLTEYFGNVFDYLDTTIDLYLPFIGIVNLNVSDVMRSTLTITYHVDVLTGACLVDVEIMRDAVGGVLYQYSGECAVHYPVSAGSYMGIVTGILSIAGGIAGTVATGGAAAPVLIGAGAAATRMHTNVSRSGGFSGNSGAMGAKKPYLIISRPQTALPESYLEIEGIGSNKTVMLNTCAGYTRIKEVYLQGIGDATEGELNELETLLKAGVIFPITETPPNE